MSLSLNVNGKLNKSREVKFIIAENPEPSPQTLTTPFPLTSPPSPLKNILQPPLIAK